MHPPKTKVPRQISANNNRNQKTRLHDLATFRVSVGKYPKEMDETIDAMYAMYD